MRPQRYQMRPALPMIGRYESVRAAVLSEDFKRESTVRFTRRSARARSSMSRSEPPRQRWVQPGACDQLCRLGEVRRISLLFAQRLFADLPVDRPHG
jgi:hypothetical protein